MSYQEYLYEDQIKDIFLNKKTFIIGKKESGKSTIASHIIDKLIKNIDIIHELYEDLPDIDNYTISIDITEHYPENILDDMIDLCIKNKNKNILILLNFSSCIQYRTYNNFLKLFDQQNLTLIGYSIYPEKFDNGRSSLYNIILTKDYNLSSASAIANYYAISSGSINLLIQNFIELMHYEFILLDRYDKKMYHILDTPCNCCNIVSNTNKKFSCKKYIDSDNYIIPEIKDVENDEI
jgi:hypothetical protein